ncbi:PIN domain-containing protein [Halogranum gelatinilyticum]|nr:hypothetical protein [Halogranum gelatinilyticum]
MVGLFAVNRMFIRVCIIRRTVDVLDEPVLTRNVDGFERLGVAVETY